MNFSKLSRKLRKKIIQISGEVSAGLDKTARRFVSECFYGLLASQSVLMTKIGRSLEEPIALKKTQERLYRQLNKRRLWEVLHQSVLEKVSDRIQSDTLLVLDLSDITKPYAEQMEYLARVRNGNTGEIGNGYWLVEVIATEVNNNDVLPVYSDVYSQLHPDFKSENDEILKAIGQISRVFQKKGIWIIDRGADRNRLFIPLLRDKCRFVIRLVGDRHLEHHGKLQIVEDLARQCECPYAETITRLKNGREKSYSITYGYLPVRLPIHKQQLYLLVIKGFGEKPLMLLTTEPLRRNRAVLRQVAKMYFKRWRIEETIRFIKQNFDLENIRLLRYQSIRNLLALLLLTFFFMSVVLNLNLKFKIMAGHIFTCSKRVFGIPDFTFYALSDGISFIFVRSPAEPFFTIQTMHFEKQLPLF